MRRDAGCWKNFRLCKCSWSRKTWIRYRRDRNSSSMPESICWWIIFYLFYADLFFLFAFLFVLSYEIRSLLSKIIVTRKGKERVIHNKNRRRRESNNLRWTKAKIACQSSFFYMSRVMKRAWIYCYHNYNHRNFKPLEGKHYSCSESKALKLIQQKWKYFQKMG